MAERRPSLSCVVGYDAHGYEASYAWQRALRRGNGRHSASY